MLPVQKISFNTTSKPSRFANINITYKRIPQVIPVLHNKTSRLSTLYYTHPPSHISISTIALLITFFIQRLDKHASTNPSSQNTSILIRLPFIPRDISFCRIYYGVAICTCQTLAVNPPITGWQKHDRTSDLKSPARSWSLLIFCFYP